MSRLPEGSGTLAVVTAHGYRRGAVRRRRPRWADPAGDTRHLTGAPCPPSSLASRDINIVLLTAQIKHGLRPPALDDAVKLKVTFCVRGVLSPLLSNIVLDELDRELARRGHRFVRYADDENIYVRSERAGHRVMVSVVRFIETQLRLRVNQTKSAVARPEERHFVGFSLRRNPEDGVIEVFLSKRSKDCVDAKIRELTPRAWGQSLRGCITTLNTYLRGWLHFFGTSCTDAAVRTLQLLDAHIRRRLRALLLRQWKRRRFIVRRLIRMGARAKTAWRLVYEGRKSLWALSHCGSVDYALSKMYFAEQGLVSLEHQYRDMHRVVAPAQMILALE